MCLALASFGQAFQQWTRLLPIQHFVVLVRTTRVCIAFDSAPARCLFVPVFAGVASLSARVTRTAVFRRGATCDAVAEPDELEPDEPEPDELEPDDDALGLDDPDAPVAEESDDGLCDAGAALYGISRVMTLVASRCNGSTTDSVIRFDPGVRSIGRVV